MNNETIINPFIIDDSNITNIKTRNCQIMRIITNIISKLIPMIKKPLVANHTFFTVITFKKINFFAYIKFIVTQHKTHLSKLDNYFSSVLKRLSSR